MTSYADDIEAYLLWYYQLPNVYINFLSASGPAGVPPETETLLKQGHQSCQVSDMENMVLTHFSLDDDINDVLFIFLTLTLYKLLEWIQFQLSDLIIVTVPSLSSLMAPEVVMMTTSGPANDEKVGTMTNVRFHW